MRLLRMHMTHPENRQKALELAKDAERGRISEKIASGLNVLLAGGDIAASMRQINESNRLLGENKKPSRPGVPKTDPYLDPVARGLP